MTENTRKTKSWDELTFADNFLRLNHRFRRDSLKTHLVSFTGFAVAPYLQNSGKRAGNLPTASGASSSHRD